MCVPVPRNQTKDEKIKAYVFEGKKNYVRPCLRTNKSEKTDHAHKATMGFYHEIKALFRLELKTFLDITSNVSERC